jgi:hypothetical protein
VYLFPSEVALRNLLGSQLSSLFTFIVASHRAVVSAGAAEVAKQERERIVAMGPEAGGRMAASLVGLLRNSNTCEAGVWLDGLRPLATMPVAATTEVIQDYLVEEIENFKAGRLPRWRCAQVTSSAQLRDRLIADLFLLYLDTKPDPFEVLELHTDLSTRISSQRTKVAIGFNVSFYVGKLFKKSA